MAQSSFEERLVRINSGKQVVGEGLTLNKSHLLGETRNVRNFQLHMLVAGALIGGVFGVLFAFNIGLFALVDLTPEAIYELILAEWMKGALIGAVAIAPIGLLFSLMFVRGRPGNFVFWIGYVGGVAAANRADIEVYIATLQTTSIG